MALGRLRADLHLEHCQYVEDLELKFKEKEKENQLEVGIVRGELEEILDWGHFTLYYCLKLKP